MNLRKEVKHNPVLLSWAAFFFLTGIMGTRPLVPLLSEEVGVGPGEIGVIVAVFSLLPLLFTIYIGKWIDQHGTKKVMRICSVLGSLSLIIPFIMKSELGIYLSQLFSGIAFTVFVLSSHKYAGSASDSWAREKSVAIFSVGVASGGFLGPLIGGFFSELFGFGWAFFLLSIFGVLSVFFVWFMNDVKSINAENSTVKMTNPLRIFKYNENLGRAFLISSLILLARDMYTAYFPLYASDIGMSTILIGVIVAIHNSGAVIVRAFLVNLIKRFNKNKIIVGSIMMSGIFFLFVPFFQNTALLILLSLLIGLGLGVGQPLSISTTINLSPKEKVGEVLGLRLSCNRLTQFVTPLIFGGLVVFSSVSSVFWIVGMILSFGSMKVSIPEKVMMKSMENNL